MKQPLLLSALLALFVSYASAQHKIDSIVSLLGQTQHDTLRARRLLHIAFELRSADQDSALRLCDRALKLAGDKHIKLKGSIYNTRGTIWLTSSDYIRALEDKRMASNLFKQADFLRGSTDVMMGIGTIHYYARALDSAYWYYAEGTRLAEQMKHNSLIITGRMNMAMIISTKGQKEEALKLYLEALKMAEASGLKQEMASMYNNVALIYGALKQPDQAIEYFEMAAVINTALLNSHYLAINYNNMGSQYSNKKDHVNSVKYYLLADSLYRKVKNAYGVSNIQLALGSADLRQKDYQSAEKRYGTALRIADSINATNIASLASVKLAEAKIHLGKMAEAGPLLARAEALCIAGEDLEGLIDVSGVKALLHTKQGNHALAAEEYLRLIALKDSFLNVSSMAQMNELKTVFETEKKEAAITLLNKDREIQDKELQRQSLQRNALILGLLLVLALAGISYAGYVRKKRDNHIITRQKEEVEGKNREITESITYARRLQEAVLPPARVVREFFNDSFLLYMPRDIVSGDFYWMESKGGVSYFAVGDCTGHGVPGAMLSVIGLKSLSHCLNEMGLTRPKDILTQMTLELLVAFEGADTTVQDGMDIALCALDIEAMTVTFCGANNPLWIARDGAMLEVEPSKRPVGHYSLERAFTQQTVPVLKGDTLYIFSDGFADQQGGARGKKFMRKTFRELLLEGNALPMSEQRKTLIDRFTAWKGDYEQTDDVCIMGVRL